MKKDMKDLGIFYLWGLFNVDKNRTLWIRNKSGTYEPILQWFLGSFLLGFILVVLFILLLVIRFSQ